MRVDLSQWKEEYGQVEGSCEGIGLQGSEQDHVPSGGWSFLRYVT